MFYLKLVRFLTLINKRTHEMSNNSMLQLQTQSHLKVLKFKNSIFVCNRIFQNKRLK